MKNFKFLFWTLVCLMFTFNFTSCDKDDDKGFTSENLSPDVLDGHTWRGFFSDDNDDEASISFIYNNTCIVLMSDTSEFNGGVWNCNYSISQNKIILTVIKNDYDTSFPISYLIYNEENENLIAYSSSNKQIITLYKYY